MFKTVRSKFALGYLGLIVLIILLGLVSIFTMSSIRSTIEGLITTNYNSIDRLNKMKDAVWNQRMAVEEYLNGDSIQAAIKFEQYKGTFTEFYDIEEGTIILPNEQQYIEEIWSRFERYQHTFLTLTSYDLSDPEEYGQALEYREKQMEPAQTLLAAAIQKLYSSNETALFERRDQAIQAAQTATRMLTVIFPLAAIFGLWMSNIYAKRFLAPIDQITQQIKLVRQGNLSDQELITGQDEFGMLADEFRRMLQRLSEFEKSTLGSLMEEKRRTDTIAKSINEPMLVLDDQGKILLLNRALSRLAGVDEESVLNQSIQALFPGGELSEYLAMVVSDPWSVEQEKIVVQQERGEDQFYHVVVTPIPGADGENAGCIVLLHDVTEMKKLEKARGDFIATISHEFKTPLTSIIMGADLMRSELVGPITQDQREIVETICEDSQRLENLVGEMLELSRIESASTIYKFEPCDLKSVIRASCSQFEMITARNHISFTVRIPENLPLVNADFSKVTWVLNNLLSNAMKYTREGGAVTVSARVEHGEALVSVEDDGVGVPPEFTDKIFEKFVQLKGYDLEVRGTGVGLAAAKEIITAHRGKIWCETDRPVGSRFCFTLPLTEKEEHDGSERSDR